LAQSRDYRRFPDDATAMFRVNVTMTAAVLDLAAKLRARQFCLASSGGVYEPFEGTLSETVPLVPTSYLGASKLAAEVISRPYAGLFNTSILRLFFPFGPGQRDRLVPNLIARIRRNEEIEVAADGEGPVLTPTFADDVVHVFMECLAGQWSGTFNVASGRAISIAAMARTIGRELGTETRFKRASRPPLRIDPDLKRLRERIDSDRFTTFEEGLRRTLAAG